MLSRCSFRQLLLVAFLLIAGLLVATSVRALFTLESVAAHSRQASRQAVDMTEHLQRLQERTAAMERAARQFLVLDDPIFKARYQEAAAQAQLSLDAVAADMPNAAKDIISAWKSNRAALTQVLQQPAAQRSSAAADVQQALARLPALNQQLSDLSDAQIGSHNDVLLEELDQQRAMLSWQVIGAIVLAVLLACVFGLWLSMPLAQLEAAIDRLGSGRFDTPIAIQGPADLRRLGQQLDWLQQRLARIQAEKIRFIENVARRLRTSDAGGGQQRQIADVLNYHEAVLQAQQVHRLPVDVRVLLNKIVDDHRGLYEARGIRVEVSGSVAMMGLDLTKMEYVLGSLLSNAVRFSPPAGVVRFLIAQGGRGGLQLDCIDQGPGVAEEDAPYIFDPFHPARPSAPGDRPGMPVSLAIAREYIEAQHGGIVLLPTPGGAHFRIVLPDEY
ncbi:HAMP domain-containing protein [Oxalobacteraceae bacterium CAVE-383]|nr:HAMP domain-containing protein [Oxalobacteraceae bacterium CAVE-383]